MDNESNDSKKSHIASTFGKFSDALINNLVMTKLSGILDTGFEMTYVNVFKILLLFSIGDIKTSISYAS